MSAIENRIAKLEQKRRGETIVTRPPGIPADAMQTIRNAAAACGTVKELSAYLKGLEDNPTDHIVSLDDHRRSDTVRSAFARALFDEMNG
ncbi:hypothetical protein [Sphingomonas sp. PWP1-2]|uniref:hypothetical protein n=1 Tax=Sphingomonas sp. PWP1-2 TaxID=2804558 RepID=UPI003CEC8F48